MKIENKEQLTNSLNELINKASCYHDRTNCRQVQGLKEAILKASFPEEESMDCIHANWTCHCCGNEFKKNPFKQIDEVCASCKLNVLWLHFINTTKTSTVERTIAEADAMRKTKQTMTSWTAGFGPPEPTENCGDANCHRCTWMKKTILGPNAEK